MPVNNHGKSVPHLSDKCPNWEETARERSQTFAYGLDGRAYGVSESIPQEAVKMGATVQSNEPPEAITDVESAASDIQTRLEILKILFSSPHVGPDRGFTTKQVENWVKTGNGHGLTFVK